MRSHNVQVSAEFLKFDAVESFSEDVGSHVGSGNVRHGDFTGGNSLSNEMKMHVDVLRTTVKGCVF